MLNNVEHPAWRHPTTAQAFDRVLGHFASSFCDVVREISGKLTEMEGKLLSRPSGWVAATRPQYQASLKELRALTEDLSKIRARVTTTNNGRRKTDLPETDDDRRLYA
jgi:septal ring factor EnvC (AmiA/AmiB activator)